MSVFNVRPSQCFVWFWKLCGCHVCEDFTPWVEERKRLEWESPMGVVVWFTRCRKERTCTVCGKVEKRVVDI